MKVVGVIAEFNPFHNGHAYFLQKAKEITKADYCIVVMSGNFVQRGAPAIMDKYIRTQAALSNGADLVLELPVYYATASAELFSAGAVSILDNLGIVDNLAFGCETNDFSLLTAAADILFREPPFYQQMMKDLIAAGKSYPAAQNEALQACLRADFPETEFIFSMPNNLLAITYIKTLKRLNSRIQPVAVHRRGNYHSVIPEDNINVSATALRKLINGDDFDEFMPDNELFTILSNYMPDNVLCLLKEAYQKTMPVAEDDLSEILLYSLLMQRTEKENFMNYLDVTDELANRFQNNLFEYQNFSQFASLCTTKESTRARINRALLHILLQIKNDDLQTADAFHEAPYARMLGCRKEAVPLLKSLKEHAKIPIIGKPSIAQKQLSPEAERLWNLDITSAHIYEMLSAQRYGHPIRHEYQRTICGLTD